MSKEKETVIGTVPVFHTGQALYFTMDGGTFKHEGVEGEFMPTVGGTAVIIYIDGEAYECRTADIAAAAVKHHLAEKKAAKARDDLRAELIANEEQKS